jgi:hypothetical protein
VYSFLANVFGRKKAKVSEATRYHCPKSVTGHGSADINGKCPWCGYKIDSKMSRLGSQIGATTDIDDYYGYYWDPDFGAPE